MFSPESYSGIKNGDIFYCWSLPHPIFILLPGQLRFSRTNTIFIVFIYCSRALPNDFLLHCPSKSSHVKIYAIVYQGLHHATLPEQHKCQCQFYIIQALSASQPSQLAKLGLLAGGWPAYVLHFEIFGSAPERYQKSFRCEDIFHRPFTSQYGGTPVSRCQWELIPIDFGFASH